MLKFLIAMVVSTFMTLHFVRAAQSDAERYASTEMNSGPAAKADRAVAGGVRVLFLGNSITLHRVSVKIGWTNNWGMAASAREKDYAHLVVKGIERETATPVDMRIRNLYAFEKGFKTWDCTTELAKEIACKPDYIVIALGENVAELPEGPERMAFRESFKRLLGCFITDKRRPKVVVRGTFWPNAWKEEVMSGVAKEFDVPFVGTGDLSQDDAMKATGLFVHQGIQAHPGDRGMAAIANRILKAFFGRSGGQARLID